MCSPSPPTVRLGRIRQAGRQVSPRPVNIDRTPPVKICFDTGMDLDRLVRDVTATTDLRVAITQDPDGEIEFHIEGDTVLRYWSVHLDLALAATQLQSSVLIERLGAAWPCCLQHGRHPMRARDDAWECPHDPSFSVPIGSLRPSDAKEPVVPDGRVRWWRDDLGWGVVAHGAGDIWVHSSAIVGEGYRSLNEDELVTWTLDGGRQGTFRRARTVTRLG